MKGAEAGLGVGGAGAGHGVYIYYDCVLKKIVKRRCGVGGVLKGVGGHFTTYHTR